MNRKRRTWFFDAPPTTDGRRFRSQNIPSEETMAILLDSTAFISEPRDGASPMQQGLIKYYLNDDAIANRDNPNLQQGNIYALLPNQAPGVGVNDGNGYQESNPDDSIFPLPVKGGGISVIGVVNTKPAGIKRIGYQVGLNVDSLDLLRNSDLGKLEIPVHNTDDGKQYKIILGTDFGKTPPSHFTHDQDIASTSWKVSHNLGYKPGGVSVEINREIVEAEVRHTDNNNLTIELSLSRSGKVYVS